MSEFTKGPWKVGYLKNDVGVADDGKTGGYAKLFDVRGWGYLTGKGHGGLGLDYDAAVKIQEANANLIAAAPELYEALYRLVRDCEIAGLQEQVGFDCWISMANAALAKALGKTVL